MSVMCLSYNPFGQAMEEKEVKNSNFPESQDKRVHFKKKDRIPQAGQDSI